MDELVVVGDVGELVDLVLIDFEPVADTFVVADVRLVELERLRCSLTHGKDPNDDATSPDGADAGSTERGLVVVPADSCGSVANVNMEQVSS